MDFGDLKETMDNMKYSHEEEMKKISGLKD
jgi:hypothetical protein